MFLNHSQNFLICLLLHPTYFFPSFSRSTVLQLDCFQSEHTLLYLVLAVSTHPPAGINYRASFISIHQVAAATALLLLLMLMRAWFSVVRQVSLTCVAVMNSIIAHA